MMKHDHNLENREDGLSHCLTCGGGEGSLPTRCPGFRLASEQHDAIYGGELDFDRGPMDPVPVWWEKLHASAKFAEQKSPPATKQSSSYWVRIYMSGPIEVAKQVLRAECMREGLCVTIEPTTFIYTGGEEGGFVVGLLNYPRFPCEPAALRERARLLVSLLLAATHQHSALWMAPDMTEWVTLRTQS